VALRGAALRGAARRGAARRQRAIFSAMRFVFCAAMLCSTPPIALLAVVSACWMPSRSFLSSSRLAAALSSSSSSAFSSCSRRARCCASLVAALSASSAAVRVAAAAARRAETAVSSSVSRATSASMDLAPGPAMVAAKSRTLSSCAAKMEWKLESSAVSVDETMYVFSSCSFAPLIFSSILSSWLASATLAPAACARKRGEETRAGRAS
jgi:hypothetical protein